MAPPACWSSRATITLATTCTTPSIWGRRTRPRRTRSSTPGRRASFRARAPRSPSTPRRPPRPSSASSMPAGPRGRCPRPTRAGTPATQTWAVDISSPDVTPPQVTLTAPAQGAQVGGTVDLTATASDDVAVDHVDFLVDGSLVGADASSPYALTWDSPVAPEGPAPRPPRAVGSSLHTR